MPRQEGFFMSVAFAVAALIYGFAAGYGTNSDVEVRVAFAILASFLGGTAFGIFINICTRNHNLTDDSEETVSGRA